MEKEGEARGAEREGAGEGRGGDGERGERGGERLPLNWTLTGGRRVVWVSHICTCKIMRTNKVQGETHIRCTCTALPA